MCDPWIGLAPVKTPGPFAAGGDPAQYVVTEYGRTYTFDATVTALSVTACGDTVFQLFLNGDCIMTGPPSVGGDFIGNDTPRDNFYTFEVTLSPAVRELTFWAQVQTMPVQLFEFSKGQGGFMMKAHAVTADGAVHALHTDTTWQVRKSTAHTAPFCFDSTIPAAPFVSAVALPDIWHATPAPIPVREEYLCPLADATVTIAAGESVTRTWELPRIYGGFLGLQTAGEGTVNATFAFSEQGEEGSREEEPRRNDR